MVETASTGYWPAALSADSITALKFFDAGTQAFEGEIGMTINEPGTYAVKAAIEMAVLELIKEGQRKGVWDFQFPYPEETHWYDFGKKLETISAKGKTDSTTEVLPVAPNSKIGRAHV